MFKLCPLDPLHWVIHNTSPGVSCFYHLLPANIKLVYLKLITQSVKKERHPCLDDLVQRGESPYIQLICIPISPPNPFVWERLVSGVVTVWSYWTVQWVCVCVCVWQRAGLADGIKMKDCQARAHSSHCNHLWQQWDLVSNLLWF